MDGILTINNKAIEITDVTVRPEYETRELHFLSDDYLEQHTRRVCTGFALSGQVESFDPSTDLTLAMLECEEFKGEVYVSQCSTPKQKGKKQILRISSYGKPEKHPEIQYPASYK